MKYERMKEVVKEIEGLLTELKKLQKYGDYEATDYNKTYEITIRFEESGTIYIYKSDPVFKSLNDLISMAFQRRISEIFRRVEELENEDLLEVNQ